MPSVGMHRVGMPSLEMPTGPDADRLDVLAAELDRLAASVVTHVEHVEVLHRPDVWRGRRADRFGEELDRAGARVRGAAETLTEAAAASRRRAAALRATPVPGVDTVLR